MANNASPHNADQPLFIEEVQGHQARYTKVIELTHSATKAAGVMLLAAIAALAIANSGIYGQFEYLIHTQIGFVVGDSISAMSIAHIINDILMAVFFLLVGLEIKYEMTVGELTNIRQAILPIVAACSRLLLFMRFSISRAPKRLVVGAFPLRLTSLSRLALWRSWAIAFLLA